MRLSESLRRGIMKAYPGHIMNTFKMSSRRNVLVFEEILANYIKKCGESGHEKEMGEIGERWACIFVEKLIPNIFRNAPVQIIFSNAEKTWKNVGLVEKLSITAEGDMIKIETKNETITRIVGKNSFMTGILRGFLKVACKTGIEIVYARQTKLSSIYMFKKNQGPYEQIPSKDKRLYDLLNECKSGGGKLDFRMALKSNIFQLKEDNRIYFRKKSLVPLENTIVHLIGNKGVHLESIPSISYTFFEKLVSKNSPERKKLILLKTIIHITGWGNARILENGCSIKIEIENPPCGFQEESDNYVFLCNMILGYLWLLSKKFRISHYIRGKNKLTITYTK
jgi:hypothetical protein